MRDPLRDVEPLLRRVYAYAAYRLGDGSDAEDITSETFERALRYRHSYNPGKGSPSTWLVGIARRCVDDLLRGRAFETLTDNDMLLDRVGDADPAQTAAVRLDLAAAIAVLDGRDRELIALRYGADLKAKDIASLLGQRTNAIEVALHRALERLRLQMDGASR